MIPPERPLADPGIPDNRTFARWRHLTTATRIPASVCFFFQMQIRAIVI